MRRRREPVKFANILDICLQISIYHIKICLVLYFKISVAKPGVRKQDNFTSSKQSIKGNAMVFGKCFSDMDGWMFKFH